jgi:Family of unknown function (DUF6361)
MSSSTFTWLAYDDAERDQVAALVRALDEPETLDSLGLGIVRDTIANLLFPGISTIQTRVRYFVLVARAVVEVERSGPKNTAEFDTRLRTMERRTLDALRSCGDRGSGIVGWYSGWATKRWPSSIYWNGLSEWGVRRVGGSLRSYSVAVVSHARRRGQRLADEPGEADGSSAWWDELPTWEGDQPFPGALLEIEPTWTEAVYLLDRMSATFAGGTARPANLAGQCSLLSHIARNLALAEAQSPWDIKVADPYLTEVLVHADLFSLVLHGAQLRYNRLLVERAWNLDNQVDDTALNMLEDTWLSEMTDRLDQVTAWARDFRGFVAVIRHAGGRISRETRAFYQAWIEAAAKDPEEAYSDDRLADLVREREQHLKRRNARLLKSEALTRWDGALFGAGRLDYRWRVAQRHLIDCMRALGSRNGHARR